MKEDKGKGDKNKNKALKSDAKETLGHIDIFGLASRHICGGKAPNSGVEELVH